MSMPRPCSSRAAEAAEETGRPAEAADLYRRCLDLDPGDAIAAFNRANCLRVLGRLEEAELDYCRALQRDPGLVEAWFNLAGVLAERGRTDAARRQLRQAIARDPDYADAIFNLARLEFEAGDLDEASRRMAALSRTRRRLRLGAAGGTGPAAHRTSGRSGQSRLRLPPDAPRIDARVDRRKACPGIGERCGFRGSP
jgi:tetratricopeptide (TPR) repeat protein